MRVLLIEDEPTTARAIELMLSAEGLNVYTTDLGEEGIEHREGRRFVQRPAEDIGTKNQRFE